MDNHQNKNQKTCQPSASTDLLQSLNEQSNHHRHPDRQTSKKMIYNRSRIVHMDEMIRAIFPKLDTKEQESVQQCYEAWKRKQVKTHTLLCQLRNIVSSDILYNEVERIRQEKWKRSKQSTTKSCSKVTPSNDENKEKMRNLETWNNNLTTENRQSASEENLVSLSDKPQVKRSWTREEHFLFLQGLEEYGKGQWQLIADKIGTKTASQVRSHCKKYLMRQQKDQQSKKMKTIHDMTMESPEMQQLAKKQKQEQESIRRKEENVCILDKCSDPSLGCYNILEKETVNIPNRERNHVVYSCESNPMCKNTQTDDEQGEITKIPYFMRERRIRSLEHCLLQVKHSMDWMLGQITRWESSKNNKP